MTEAISADTNQPEAEPFPELAIARRLAAAGIPIFIAHPADNKTGFVPPKGWEHTKPDPEVVWDWHPGLALCAVMGHGLDLIDLDPRNGAQWPSDLPMPRVHGVARTPSGGLHAFIASLGVGSRDNVFPGIDIKGGRPDGTGRGFAFIAPTVRASAVDGTHNAYRWTQTPEISRHELDYDHSGRPLAERVSAALSGTRVTGKGGPAWWRDFLLSREPQSAPAAERAITEKVREVANWTMASGVGFRLTLMRAAMTLGGYVGGGWLDIDDARSRLEWACGEVWGKADSDDRKWIDQGLSDGETLPFTVYTAADALTHSAPVLGDEALLPYASAARWTIYDSIGTGPFDPQANTDQELADAVLERCHPGLRYATDAGLWLVRDRERWREQDKAEGSAVSALGRLMPLGDGDLPKKVSDYTAEHWQAKRRARFLASGTAGAIERKMTTVVRTVGHSGAVELAALDSDPTVLWAGGVPWDLRASGVEPAPATWVPLDTPHMHTAWVAPDPSVDTPLWDAFVRGVLPDEAIRRWALRVLSISLTGYADAALPILFGRERSGKTSIIEILMRVLGTYGKPANPKLLSAGDNSHDAIVYELRGARLAFIDEGPKRGHDATERLKQLTGGGQLTGRPMRANPISFKPTHTLVMTTNTEPVLTDPALRARARIIPCNADEAVILPLRLPLLDEVSLRREAPGILAAMMREAAHYLADRYSATAQSAPESITALTAEISEGQDPVRHWVNDCTVPSDPGTPGRQLYSQFAEWHQSKALYRRMSVPTETAFGRTLTDMGYPSHKTRSAWYRPLSILGGPGMPTVAPTPAGYMADSGGYEQVRRVEGGSGSQPAATDFPSSTPVSVSSCGVLAGLSINNIVENNNNNRESKYSDLPANPENPPNSALNVALTSTNTGGGVVGGDSPPTRPQVKSDREPALSPERSAVAARAAADKVSKAEARARVREEARLAAVAEASGEVLALPVVVDRAGNVVDVSVDQAAATLVQCMTRFGGLCVDVETSGYPIGHKLHKLRSVQLGDDVAAVVLDPVEHAGLIRQALKVAPRLVAHSASADIHPIGFAGLGDAETLWAKMDDTVIPAKLGDPQSTGSDPALKQLSATVLGSDAVSPAADAARSDVFKAGKWLVGKQKYVDQLTMDPARNGWAQIETGSEVMLRYAASDVLDTAALAKRLPPVPGKVHDRERTAEWMTSRIGYRGLLIDHPRVLELTDLHINRRAEAGCKLREFGIDNAGSNPQIAKALTDLGAELPISEKGNPSVAEHVLTTLKRTDGDAATLAGHVLEYRHADTALGLFLGPYDALCTHGDGRVRPTIYTLGTDTGRMSSVRPNCQQLPRGGGVRSIIVADPGHVLISADFSGVELRGAAALSQDQAMLWMIKEEDEGRFDGFHWQVARQAFGPNATKDHRYTAKRGVFGTFYGGGAAGLARQVGVPVEEMEVIRESLREIAPAYFQWASGMRDAVRAGHTQFPAYSGRIIHLPADTPHKAPAYAIQGTCRELLVDGLMEWRKTQWGECTLMPVHDELLVMVPEDDAEEATATLVECMASELYGVRIVAEPSEPSRVWQDSV